MATMMFNPLIPNPVERGSLVCPFGKKRNQNQKKCKGPRDPPGAVAAMTKGQLMTFVEAVRGWKAGER